MSLIKKNNFLNIRVVMHEIGRHRSIGFMANMLKLVSITIHYTSVCTRVRGHIEGHMGLVAKHDHEARHTRDNI